MNDPRGIRNFLGLRLVDVERATGVAAARISEWERGIARLNPLERWVVESFLRDRLRSYAALEADLAVTDGAQGEPKKEVRSTRTARSDTVSHGRNGVRERYSKD